MRAGGSDADGAVVVRADPLEFLRGLDNLACRNTAEVGKRSVNLLERERIPGGDPE